MSIHNFGMSLLQFEQVIFPKVPYISLFLILIFFDAHKPKPGKPLQLSCFLGMICTFCSNIAVAVVVLVAFEADPFTRR